MLACCLHIVQNASRFVQADKHIMRLAMQTEEQLKKRVGAKLEVAKFLQDTVSEMAKDMRTSKTGAAQASAADLYQFMKRVETL